MALYEIEMESRPGFSERYKGKVDVNAKDEREAAHKAKDRVFFVHGHRDWRILSIRTVTDERL